ncbi:hypothetical protein ACVZD4_04265 [Escherichia coli]
MPPLPDAAWTPYPAYEWRESVGLISVAHQAFVTIAGCGVNALSGLRVAREL